LPTGIPQSVLWPLRGFVSRLGCCVLGFIVAQVAALAQGRKVKKAVVVLIMVYVGHG
jgi:hypothetical protein